MRILSTTIKIISIIGTMLAFSISLTACQPQQSAKVYGNINGETMGTSYHISFELPEGADSPSVKEIQTDIDEKLVAFNNELSTWQKDSTITKFNNSPADTAIAINRDFTKVMGDSKQVYEQSGGAFNPTVKPILELWGFGTEMRVDRLQNPPTDVETAEAKKLIDFDSVHVLHSMKLNDNKIIKINDGVALDFSAIAKGYGVDVIADVLQSNYQINNYMVEIGGELATSGINDKGQGWQIAIDAPILHSGVADRKLIATIRQPVNESKKGSMYLATSGNYRNSIVFDGVRYSHTIDPSTGKPIVGGVPSVTVVDDSVALADAWATAFTAMPYDKALTTAKNLNKAVMFVLLKEGVDTNKESHSNEDWQVVETDAMKRLRAGK